jgi:hypothetical protein
MSALDQFLKIQTLRIVVALVIVLGMIAIGLMARSAWIIAWVAPLYTVLYALGKWNAWRAAWAAGGVRQVAQGLLLVLPIQLVLAGVLYLIGLGLGRLVLGAVAIAPLTWGDIATVAGAFLLCVAASALIIRAEAKLRMAVTTDEAPPTPPAVPLQDAASMQNAVNGRIYFPGNPWPGGHRVVSCALSAIIHPAVGTYASDYANPGPGLMLQLTLESANYDEEDQSDHYVEGEHDWTSKIVWNNYGRCRLGPSQSSQVPGIRVSDGSVPFEFGLASYRFAVDRLPPDGNVDWETFHETVGFGLYLLGHDAVADHDIHLHSRQADGSYTLDWSGRIALTYGGGTTFEHAFHAQVTGVKFDAISLFYFDVARTKEYCGVELDPNLSARDYIAPFVTNPDDFIFEMMVDGIDRQIMRAVPMPRVAE